MPRWLTTLVILVLLLGFVLPDPVGAGHAVGNGINSMLVFLKSAGNALGAASVLVPRAPARPALPDRRGWLRRRHHRRTAAAHFCSASGRRRFLPVPAPEPQTGLSYSPPVQLRIPSIGVTSGFVSLGLESDGALEVPQAADVVGWYRDAPTPGERGPAVVTAHVDWQHNRGIFHDLGRLKPGDDVIIDRADGVPVTFRVSRVEEYPKTRFPTHDVYGDTDGVELRMITCGGRFDDRTHSYDQNIVVFARMSGVG